MLQIVTEPQEAIGLYLVANLPDMTSIPGGYYCLGVCAEDGSVRGAVMFTNYRPCKGGGDIEVSCAGHGWLSRRVIRTVFAHPFDILGCHRVTAITRKVNKPARRLLEGIGFQLEGRLRQAYGPRSHGVLYSLLKDEWAASPLSKV